MDMEFPLFKAGDVRKKWTPFNVCGNVSRIMRIAVLMWYQSGVK